MLRWIFPLLLGGGIWGNVIRARTWIARMAISVTVMRERILLDLDPCLVQKRWRERLSISLLLTVTVATTHIATLVGKGPSVSHEVFD